MKYEDAFGAANEIVSIGKLHLPSGVIAASDPFFCAAAIPYSRSVPPGSYVVQVRVARSSEWGVRIGLARIVFEPEVKVVKLEQAVTSPAWPNSYFVNSGLASV